MMVLRTDEGAEKWAFRDFLREEASPDARKQFHQHFRIPQALHVPALCFPRLFSPHLPALLNSPPPQRTPIPTKVAEIGNVPLLSLTIASVGRSVVRSGEVAVGRI